MPKLGEVEYDDVGWEFMTQVYAQRQLDGALPGTLKHEAYIVHTIYETFPGTKMLSAEGGRAADAAPAGVGAQRAHARGTDPWTSHAAARSLDAETLRKTQEAVLACFKTYGPMTHEKLVVAYVGGKAAFSWPDQSVSGLRTRTSELVTGGHLRDSGRVTRLDSGRKSIIWEPV